MSYSSKKSFYPIQFKPKIINQFARLQSQIQKEAQSKIMRQSRLIKLKSINQLILADDNFLPQTNIKSKIIKSAFYQQVHYEKEELSTQIINPQKCIKSCIQIKSQTQVQKSSKSVQTIPSFKSVFSQQNNDTKLYQKNNKSEPIAQNIEFENKYNDSQSQELQYCTDCDSPITQINHKCGNLLNNIENIHQSVNNIKSMSKKLKINRFDIIFNSIKTTSGVQMLCQFLKMIEKIDFNQLTQQEDIIKMRLENVLKKKIFFIAMKSN